MNLTPPELTYRLDKGSPLTHQEGDDNFRGLLDYTKGLVAAVDPVLNSNGTLKIFHVDTGATDAYAITPEGYLLAYTDGQIFLVKAANSNQGAATLKVASSASTFLNDIPIRKHGSSDLVAGDIVGGDVFMVVYHAGVFEFVSSGLAVTIGGSTGGSTTEGNAAFARFSPADVAVPTTVTQTFSHGLGAVPTQVIPFLVNIVAEKGYAPGDIVPIEEFVDAAGNPNFAVVFDAEDIDIVPNTATPYVAALDAGSAFQAITLASWKLRVHAYSYSGDRFESEQSDLAGDDTTTTFAHALGGGVAPTVYPVLVAVGNEPGTGSFTGDNVPLSSFHDVDGNPAFVVRVTSSQILITQNVAQPFIKPAIVRTGDTTTGVVLVSDLSATADLIVGMNVTGSGVQDGTTVASIAGPTSINLSLAPTTTLGNTPLTFGAITQTNWKLKVTAFNNLAPSSAVVAPVGLSLAGPDAAVGYGDKVFLFHNGRAGRKSHISQLDLLTNAVVRMATSLVAPNASIPWQQNINPALFNYGSVDKILWTSNKGVFSVPAADPATVPGGTIVTQYGPTLDRHLRKPVWYTEDGSGFPEIYLAASCYNTDATTGAPLAGFGVSSVNLQRYKQTGASTWVASALGPTGVALVNINLINPTILPINSEFRAYHSANSAIVLFQYNQVKKRIYVITTETGLLHIFNIAGYGTNNLAAWWEQADGTRYPQMSYEKAVSLAGFGTGSGIPGRESYCVEFDLITGQEKSICFTRIDNVNLLGSVTRVPWRES